MTRRHRKLKNFQRHLHNLVETRLSSDADHRDCVQWLIESMPKNNPWSVSKLVSKICALWFGSVHILAMTLTFALYDICEYGEYMHPLREEWQAFQEASRGMSQEERHVEMVRLPLIDSFLRESARLHPATASEWPSINQDVGMQRTYRFCQSV